MLSSDNRPLPHWAESTEAKLRDRHSGRSTGSLLIAFLGPASESAAPGQQLGSVVTEPGTPREHERSQRSKNTKSTDSNILHGSYSFPRSPSELERNASRVAPQHT